ncbi:nuclear transport factor 2 family protein [Psychroserpens sp.]|uniref:nuclear transport factor 2 family protein n=1 Tax=Psychroserpens sp. TaxID=2020870 RepID=UPI001B019A20|nr:nuclear transport factor 2 family protein [Psychroserpens sp.]MBO6607105.1 nuclear transport factor 2 family protein [Psychroserpens sp.]MBO6654251.1 nuclear transport factor 2 family protein [Psychroserpens sp.]MBO6682463.1 nuclear transport factor 2 family protein [Psychroserpens sp.]MBO6750877.1 nuclear transport factor 2 family protein [Psychroserpens sp.]MBO6915694.1 nuclear transport factor 2 family protein [Psychroserpens sp.]
MTQFIYILISLAVASFDVDDSNNTIVSHSEQDVYIILKANDSLLFERSFNKCETQYLNQLIAEDFEFYHDISGVETSKEAFIKSMKNGICNPDNTTKSRRELVPGTLEVFPLKNNGKIYGALQNGVHKFYETTNGEEVAGSIAKFSHLWILEDDEWLLQRVISYDHKLQSNNQNDSIKVSEAILDSYVGKYEAKSTGLVIISRTETGLHLNAGGMNTDINAISETVFAHNQAPLTFEFVKDASDNITKFIVRENNIIVEEAIKKQ